MAGKRAAPQSDEPPSKRIRLSWPRPPPSSGHSLIANLSDELLIRILHHLPLHSILLCQQVSRHWARLASDSQVWKGLYYGRFVRPRALRIPTTHGQKETGVEWAFSSRRSKWLEEGEESRRQGVDWKRRYKLKHNWRRGVAVVRTIENSVGDEELEDVGTKIKDKEQDARPTVGLLVRLVEGMIITVSAVTGIQAFDSKTGQRFAHSQLFTPTEREITPTCMAVAPPSGTVSHSRVRIVVGFADGSFGIWELCLTEEEKQSGSGFFDLWYRRPGTQSNGGQRVQPLTAAAYSHPYVLTITTSQVLSLYVFQKPADESLDLDDAPAPLYDDLPASEDSSTPNPRLLASLNSSTSWPPTSISLRPSPDPSIPIIAAIVYSLPTTRGACTVGLQEVHISTDGSVALTRLATSIPRGFQSLLAPVTTPIINSAASLSIPPLPRANTPTTISYNHPYLLTAHPNNTLSLYLVTSNTDSLDISSGTTLWGHGSCVLGAMVGARGKAVSFSRSAWGRKGRYVADAWDIGGLSGARPWNGDMEIRVWELESCITAGKSWQRRAEMTGGGGSVRVLGLEVVDNENESEAGSGSGSENENETGSEDSAGSMRRPSSGSTWETQRGWVGFDDEVVVVLKGVNAFKDTVDLQEAVEEDELRVYDFT